MKKTDVLVLSGVALVLAPFFLVPGFFEGFRTLSASHGFALSFFKFALLATFGECLALRIVEQCWWREGFGLMAKALVWGFLGVGIKAAFIVFATGAPHVAADLGIPVSTGTLATGSFGLKLVTAFFISSFLNLIFAPIFMTLHKITDAHIHEKGGRLSDCLVPIDFARILGSLDWGVMWGFVFKKTIPLFWIPAHTVTFLLPPDLRVLFAAVLGVVLGVILAFANLSSKKPA